MVEPTSEMLDFAQEAFRVHALSRAGLSTDQDITRLEQMGAAAQQAQTDANRR
jgi:hypothetical protein